MLQFDNPQSGVSARLDVLRNDGGLPAILDLTWDYCNRLTKVKLRPGVGAAATTSIDDQYDHRDLRIGRTEAGVTTWTTYGVDEMPICEFTGADTTPSAVFYYLPDQLDRFVGEWRSGTGMRWFLTDHRGSVKQVTDAAGTVVAELEYDAFGNTVSLTETNPGDAGSIRFAGRQLDAATGLYYNRDRWYDPAIGRFISEDPLGFGGGDNNLYRYAANDPVNAADPTGNSAAVDYAFTKTQTLKTFKFTVEIGINLQLCYELIADAVRGAADGSGGSVDACAEQAGLP